MTPHILLLTSAVEGVGGPLLVPIGNIAYVVPMEQPVRTRIFLKDRDEYLDVQEEFTDIVKVLGGLVMAPWRENRVR